MEESKQQDISVPENHLVDMKWVSVLPSDGKFALQSSQPSIQCQFTTTDGNFNMDFSLGGLNQLVTELEKIQAAIPK